MRVVSDFMHKPPSTANWGWGTATMPALQRKTFATPPFWKSDSIRGDRALHSSHLRNREAVKPVKLPLTQNHLCHPVAQPHERCSVLLSKPSCTIDIRTNSLAYSRHPSEIGVRLAFGERHTANATYGVNGLGYEMKVSIALFPASSYLPARASASASF
jgi:hypothetical protein